MKFSLRTLIVVMLLGGPLGAAVWLSRPRTAMDWMALIAVLGWLYGLACVIVFLFIIIPAWRKSTRW
jgi:hypothetical protein